ncbi:hypothetical protein CR970_00410 [Candidatus Saccharibacteria bacterium]|nr:MAG: hypothetical protein CR970_00410 [Candidatus Saccharibacteria bacterium]
MHIFFSGIGGTAIGPLAMIAHQLGHHVSGSDKQQSRYLDYLREHGISNIHVGQTIENISSLHQKQPIDWYVYSSAVMIENPQAPELEFCRRQGIRMSKRDELLNQVLQDANLKLIAIAGTHGKTTTTAMAVWLLKQIGIPISYSLGAKTSFSDMGEYVPGSEYFVYECDEFDHNFLSFSPHISLITGIDWDHPDIYPSQQEYDAAFQQFIGQSRTVVTWQDDLPHIKSALQNHADSHVLDPADKHIDKITLPGLVNRLNAWQVIQAARQLHQTDLETLIDHMNRFPGLSRRFEQITPGLYSDYAHTPPKINGALQQAKELAGDRVVVVYEGLHNTRQHFIRDELATLFDEVKQLYVVPSYLAREDPSLALLSPTDLIDRMSQQTRSHAAPAQLDESLRRHIEQHLQSGDSVVCITAGGGGSLDEWLRAQFTDAPS